MTRTCGAARAAALMLAAFAGTGGACAAQRTFVASYGNDANLCSRAAPCRSFAVATVNTASGGEVIVLDSAGYGAVTIAQSVAIIAPRGIYAGITVFSGDGVTVQGAGIDVTLRGLSISGQGGSNGVNFVQGNRLRIEGCAIANLGNFNVLLQTGQTIIADSSITRSTHFGVRVANGSVNIVDSRIESNGDDGLWLFSGAAVVQRSFIAKNGQNGITVYSASPAAVLTVSSSSIVDHSSGAGVGVVSTGASAQLNISGNTIARNGYGITASAGSGPTVINATNNQIVDSTIAGISAFNAGTIIRASGNAIFRGQYGFRTPSGGAVYSPGNNYVRDNSVLDDSTHTADTLL